jgi:SAM-dependent methyltransferase
MALLETNQRFYDPLWAGSRLVLPERFNTWPLVRGLAGGARAPLEIAPGLCPRLPLSGTRFIDSSGPAVAKLLARGADARVGLATHLPWGDGVFDLVGAFDVLEHVDEDEGLLSEVSRVASPDATLLLSAPIHAARWTAFDELVGHGRRYEPEELVAKLRRHGWMIAQSGAYGMQPRSQRLLDFVVWSFRHRQRKAIWWYTRVIVPLGAFFQEPLVMAPGTIDMRDVDEVLLVCRRAPAGV